MVIRTIVRLLGRGLSGFLGDEWERRKQSKIHFYRRISSIFKDNYPKLLLASVRDRDFLVRECLTVYL